MIYLETFDKASPIHLGTKKDQSLPWEDQLISWNADRTKAKVRIAVLYGGLNGTGYEFEVQKFGKDWVVISVHMTWVS